MSDLDTLIFVEVILMANNSSKTNANLVRQQNAQSAGQSQGQYGSEFASETDVQSVREANQKAEQNKAKNSGNLGKQS